MDFFAKLEPRERLLLLALGLLIFFVIVFGGAGSFYRYRQQLATEVKSTSNILISLQRLKSQIAMLKPQQELPKKTQIFSQVNSMLQSYQLNPISINEKQNTKTKAFEIAIRLQSVPVPNLLNFLYYVEYDSRLPLSIRTFTFRRAVAKNELYDVNFVISLANQ